MNIEKDKSLQSVYVGLDIDKLKIEICILDEKGNKLKSFLVSNTRNGFHTMIEKVVEYENVNFGVESTGPYSGNVTQFLRNINAEIVLTNPFHISRLREVFAKSVKNDPIDAYVIAQGLRMNVLQDSQKEDEYMFLQDLLERHHDLMDRKTALSNQLRSNLIQTFPEIDKCFSNISCNACLALLSQWQTAEDLLAAEEIRIREVIRKNNGRINKKQYKQLMEACSEGSGWKTSKLHKTIIKSQVRELQMILNEIKIIQEGLDEYCKRFSKELELLQSVPGVSKQISHMYLAVIGDHVRFDPNNDGKGAKRVSSYLGYGLIEYSSGPRSYKLGISKRGNSRLRGLLYMAGLVIIGKGLDMQSQFERYRNRCGNGKKAVNALAHTIARRCYGVLKSGKAYDPNIAKSIANMAA